VDQHDPLKSRSSADATELVHTLATPGALRRHSPPPSVKREPGRARRSRLLVPMNANAAIAISANLATEHACRTQAASPHDLCSQTCARTSEQPIAPSILPQRLRNGTQQAPSRRILACDGTRASSPTTSPDATAGSAGPCNDANSRDQTRDRVTVNVSPHLTRARSDFGLRRPTFRAFSVPGSAPATRMNALPPGRCTPHIRSRRTVDEPGAKRRSLVRSGPCLLRVAPRSSCRSRFVSG
jgi:hypothetical protein